MNEVRKWRKEILQLLKHDITNNKNWPVVYNDVEPIRFLCNCPN
jgi:hypothetical protein